MWMEEEKLYIFFFFFFCCCCCYGSFCSANVWRKVEKNTTVINSRRFQCSECSTGVSKTSTLTLHLLECSLQVYHFILLTTQDYFPVTWKEINRFFFLRIWVNFLVNDWALKFSSSFLKKKNKSTQFDCSPCVVCICVCYRERLAVTTVPGKPWSTTSH